MYGLKCEDWDADLHKIEKPVTARTERIRRSSNAEGNDFDLVEPRHALPTDGKERRKAKQEDTGGNIRSSNTLDLPEVNEYT
jgi:hypothetical protein